MNFFTSKIDLSLCKKKGIRFITSFLLTLLTVHCGSHDSPVIIVTVENTWNEVQNLSIDGTVKNTKLSFPTSIKQVSETEIEAQIMIGDEQVHFEPDESEELQLHVEAQSSDGCTVAHAEGAVQVALGKVSKLTLQLVRESQKQCRLTIRKSGVGTGIVRSDTGSTGVECGPTSNLCSVSLPVGQPVTLRATPGPNTHFIKWSGACEGYGPVCEITSLRQPTQVSAQFNVGVCTTPRFCWESPLPQGNTLHAISGLKQNKLIDSGSLSNVAWAVGENGTILQRKDGGWYGFLVEHPASPVTQTLFGVGVSPQDAWAVGAQGTILRWNGTSWVQHMQSNRLTTQDLLGTAAISPDQAWVVGTQATILQCDQNQCVSVDAHDDAQKRALAHALSFGSKDAWAVGKNGVVQRYDNTRNWSPSNYAAMGMGDLNKLWGTDSQNLWAVGKDNLILRYDGMKWTQQNHPELGTAGLLGLWGMDNNHLWAVGNGGLVIHTENGSDWKSIPMPEYNQSIFYDIWGQNKEEFLIVGQDGLILKGQQEFAPEAASFFPGSTQPKDQAPREPIYAVSGLNSSALWAVGQSGLILHWDGQRWQKENNPDPEQRDLRGVSVGENEVWAVGTAGVVLHRKISGANPWELFTIPTRDTLNAVAQSKTAVVAVGNLGKIWRHPHNTSLWVDQSFSGKNWYAAFGRGSEIWIAGEAIGFGKTIAVSSDQVHMDWQLQEVPDVSPIHALWGGKDGGMWAAGDGIILQLNKGTWSQSLTLVGTSFLALTGNQQEVWAAGNGGKIFQYTNKWTQVESGTQNNIRGLVSNSPFDLVVVGEHGTILRYVPPNL